MFLMNWLQCKATFKTHIEVTIYTYENHKSQFYYSWQILHHTNMADSKHCNTLFSNVCYWIHCMNLFDCFGFEFVFVCEPQSGVINGIISFPQN